MHGLHLSMMSMQPAIFDHDWVFAQTDKAFAAASKCHPCQSPTDESLDDFLVEATFHQRIVSWALYSQPGNLCLEKTTNADFGALLLSHLQTWSARLHGYSRRKSDLQGCVATAMVVASFVYGGDIRYGGRRVLPSLAMLVSQLQCGVKPWIESPGNAQLYCLFVGAHLEHQEAGVLSHWLWFTRAFVRLCYLMNLTTWAQIQERLEGFFFVEKVRLDGNLWVEGTMQTNLTAEDVEQSPTLALESWVSSLEPKRPGLKVLSRNASVLDMNETMVGLRSISIQLTDRIYVTVGPDPVYAPV